MEAFHYVGFNMWAQAVTNAGTTDPESVQDALIGVSVPNLSGGYLPCCQTTTLLNLSWRGEIQDDGQFDIVWETTGLVAGDAWSSYLPESAKLFSSWSKPFSCGAFNVETKKCSGGN